MICTVMKVNDFEQIVLLVFEQLFLRQQLMILVYAAVEYYYAQC